MEIWLIFLRWLKPPKGFGRLLGSILQWNIEADYMLNPRHWSAQSNHQANWSTSLENWHRKSLVLATWVIQNLGWTFYSGRSVGPCYEEVTSLVVQNLMCRSGDKDTIDILGFEWRWTLVLGYHWCEWPPVSKRETTSPWIKDKAWQNSGSMSLTATSCINHQSHSYIIYMKIAEGQYYY